MLVHSYLLLTPVSRSEGRVPVRGSSNGKMQDSGCLTRESLARAVGQADDCTRRTVCLLL